MSAMIDWAFRFSLAERVPFWAWLGERGIGRNAHLV